MKKKLWLIFSVFMIVSLALLSACTPAAQPTTAPNQPPEVQPTSAPPQPAEATQVPPVAGEKSITVWGFVWTADWLDAIAPKFEADHPGVKVKVERFEYDPYQEMVTTTLASGEGIPDVVTLDPMWAGDLIRSEALLPLDKATSELNVADFVPGGWNMYAFRGVQYGVPLDLDFKILFYRKDVYDKAMKTLSMDKFPTNTDDFLKLATEVVKETGKSAISIDQGDYYAWYQSFLAPLGGDLMNADATQYTFNNEAGVKALQLMSDVVNVYKVGKLWDYGTDGDPLVALKAGDVMAIMNGSWYATELPAGAPDMAGQWSIAPLPWGDANRKYDASTGGASLSIPQKAANPELAWEFLKFTMTPESQVEYYKIVNGVPSLKTSWTDASFDDVNPYFGVAVGRSVANWSLRTMPMQLPSLELSDIIGEAITKATTGELTPKEALDEAVQAAPKLE